VADPTAVGHRLPHRHPRGCAEARRRDSEDLHAFLIRSERVRPQPAADPQGGRELSPGFEVRVIESEAGWAAVARDGERLGYVPMESLLKRQ
jgi:hypothetical protein